MAKVIEKVGQERGLGTREIAGAIFLHKAKSRADTLNSEWVKYFLQNQDKLKDFYPDVYEADYMQRAQQRAEERGLIPAR